MIQRRVISKEWQALISQIPHQTCSHASLTYWKAGGYVEVTAQSMC